MTNVVTLYRPVGPKELALIEQSGWKRFPPRLPEQPIFYPVVQREYAEKIARDWNVRDSGTGFVAMFSVDGDCLSQFQEQIAGGRAHPEYWIPAERLAEFNDHIVGQIEVVAKFPAFPDVEIQISSRGQFSEVLRDVKRLVESGILRPVKPTDAPLALDDLVCVPDEGPWPDYVEAHFEDSSGRHYRLAVETYHGSGGSWTRTSD